MSKKITLVTIDGPSGSGKGTLSQLLAKKLGFHLLDSGALYRITALASLQKNIDLNNVDAVADVALNLQIRFDVSSDKTIIFLEEKNVTDAIRAETISMAASKVAAYQPVRSALLARQRAFATAPGLIADGRDMGTVVFPNAPVKLFLTASAEARAERRYKQLIAKGETVDKSILVKEIQERDDRDTKRSVSPLVPASDAVIVDSTSMSIEQVFDFMLNTIQKEI
ncbi:MAG: (d)CMP kinase [Cellvibrio sp.]|nr:(d)CMP kinase [Cellvibrio sp.]